MKVHSFCVVAIRFTLTNDSGEIIDSSDGDAPLNYLAGTGDILPGLDKALMGCDVGERHRVVVEPEEGFGRRCSQLIQKLPFGQFSDVDRIEVGMEFHSVGLNGEECSVRVLKVEDDGVTVDANHALAGIRLRFDVTIESVREATEDERSSGYVH